MYSSQGPYRDLYSALLDHSGQDVFGEVLQPWLAEHVEERRWLHSFAAPTEDGWPEANDEELCRLYAVSRVNEALLLRFQPAPSDSEEWDGPAISMDQYIEFATGLGLRVVKEPKFNPFFHEIVTAEAAGDPEQPVEVLAELWPCLMLGDLLFSRAGCAVRGGAHQLNPKVATSSVLHWARRRRHRPVSDLSVGWGSNSQWRTRFRRDYRSRNAFHFNVDGHLDALQPDGSPNPNPSREDLEPSERLELLVNRCFVRTLKDDADLWPWDDKHAADSEGR